MADQGCLLQSKRIHEAEDDLVAIRAAEVLGRAALAEAGQVKRDGAHSIGSERAQIAAEHVGRGAERTAVQQDRGNAAALLKVAKVETVDIDETIVGSDGDIHHGYSQTVRCYQLAAGCAL